MPKVDQTPIAHEKMSVGKAYGRVAFWKLRKTNANDANAPRIAEAMTKYSAPIRSPSD